MIHEIAVAMERCHAAKVDGFLLKAGAETALLSLF